MTFNTDIFLVQFGPHKGKYRWTISKRGVALDAGHEDTLEEAQSAADQRKRELKKNIP